MIEAQSMTHNIGLDIGGTKIAGAVFDQDGVLLHQHVVPTTHDYEAFLKACVDLVGALDGKAKEPCSVGIGIAGRIVQGELADASPNMQFLQGKRLRRDLSEKLKREVRIANDANCMALAEAVDGAGKGYSTVFGLTLGTGVGGGFVVNGYIVEGANGLAAEFGHVPLPFRKEADGPVVACGCKQNGCIEQSISGGALARLYAFMIGEEADAKTIAERAEAGDANALRVLDRYFEVVAKAMAVMIHTFDPEIVVVSGSLNALPCMYDEVPKRWGKYAYTDRLTTKLVPANHGPLSGMRGAAQLWK